MENVIRLYFALGLKYAEILLLLRELNGWHLSLRTLKRILKRMDLKRRTGFSDVLEVALFIQKQVLGAGSMLGYKTMHLKCVQNGFTVTQETVRFLLHIIDPEGIALRGRRRLSRRVYLSLGPNFFGTWTVMIS